MFYQFTHSGMQPVPPQAIRDDVLTVGYIQVQELPDLRTQFGFSESTVESCRVANRYFRSGVEVYNDYTFTELRTFRYGKEQEDCVALYLKRNLFLVVNVEDFDGSTKEKFFSELNRHPMAMTPEKVLFTFLDSLVGGDIQTLEDISTELSEKEEVLLHEKADKDFHAALLRLKKQLARQHNYYEQILDITDAVMENENSIFDAGSLMCISNIARKVERLREDADSLRAMVEHLQDAYSSHLEMKMNSTMKIFTVLTSIFFPLTIIVGWYGMNFRYMPELQWRYGYLYVIVLSVVTVVILSCIGKKKRWF